MLRRLIVGLGCVLIGCGGRTGSDFPGTGAVAGNAGVAGKGGSGGAGAVSGYGGYAGSGGPSGYGGYGASPGYGGYAGYGGYYPGGTGGSYPGYGGYYPGGAGGSYPGYGGYYPGGTGGSYPGYGGYYPGGAGGYYPGGTGGKAGYPGVGGASGCYYGGAYYPPGSYVTPCCYCDFSGYISCVPNCGSAGSAGSAGAGGGGTMCPPAPPEFFPSLIDDFEDGNYAPYHPLGLGTWYPYDDGSGSHTWGLTTPGFGSRYALNVSGGGTVNWGSGTGVTLRGLSDFCPFPAQSFAGITFAISSPDLLLVRVNIVTRATLPVSEGGTCTVPDGCYDHFGATLSVGYNERHSVAFGSMSQQGWGIPVGFDLSQVFGVQFQMSAGSKYNLTIDDLGFFQFIEL